MTRLCFRLAIARCLVLAAFAFPAAAFNLGQVYSSTRSGEPLNAAIEIYVAPHERA